jgi:hypothetical protein
MLCTPLEHFPDIITIGFLRDLSAGAGQEV